MWETISGFFAAHPVMIDVLSTILGVGLTILVFVLGDIGFRALNIWLENIKASTHNEYLKKALVQIEVLVHAAEQSYKVNYEKYTAYDSDQGKSLSLEEVKAINKAMYDEVMLGLEDLIKDWPVWIRMALEPLKAKLIEAAVHKMNLKQKGS